MRIGIYQNNPEFGEVSKNLDKAIDKLDTIQADLVVLPELFTTGYQFISLEEVKELAEEIPSGSSCAELTKYAHSKKIYIVQGSKLPNRIYWRRHEADGYCYNM